MSIDRFDFFSILICLFIFKTLDLIRNFIATFLVFFLGRKTIYVYETLDRNFPSFLKVTGSKNLLSVVFSSNNVFFSFYYQRSTNGDFFVSCVVYYRQISPAEEFPDHCRTDPLE